MNATISTIFEGDYHFGLGALANSAYRHGWRGTLYAGYRGSLPSWAARAKEVESGFRLDFAPGAAIQFVPLTTSAHLTHYKPDFMLDLWNGVVPEAEALFYFDPDIVLHCAWHFFEEWVSYGVALCEDVNSPLSFNHPRRAGWKKYFAEHGITLRDATEVYVNGGFVGLTKTNKTFLRTWSEIQKAMAVDLGGLRRANIGGEHQLDETRRAETYLFNRTDQDALNAALMASSCTPSIMGAEAMDLKAGGYVMAHAIGHDKPWRKSFLTGALRGLRPRQVDRYFWDSVDLPIALYSRSKIARQKLAIRFAGVMGRFYRKA